MNNLPEECPITALGRTFHSLNSTTRAIWIAVHTGWECDALCISLVSADVRIASKGRFVSEAHIFSRTYVLTLDGP